MLWCGGNDFDGCSVPCGGAGGVRDDGPELDDASHGLVHVETALRAEGDRLCCLGFDCCESALEREGGESGEGKIGREREREGWGRGGEIGYRDVWIRSLLALINYTTASHSHRGTCVRPIHPSLHLSSAASAAATRGTRRASIAGSRCVPCVRLHRCSALGASARLGTQLDLHAAAHPLTSLVTITDVVPLYEISHVRAQTA